MTRTNLDPTDVQLLDLLQRSGRMTNAELAERVGLSPSACLRRIQRLENEGIVLRYQAVLAARQVGLGLRAFTWVSMTSNDIESLEQFTRQIAEWDEVIACYSTTGESDYLLHVLTPDLEAYSRFIMQKLLVFPLVRTASSSIVLETVKREAPLSLAHLTD